MSTDPREALPEPDGPRADPAGPLDAAQLLARALGTAPVPESPTHAAD